MPKKTKKEKIIAEYRRKLYGIRGSVPTHSNQINTVLPSQQTVSASAYEFKTPIKPSAVSGAVVQPMDRAIRRDLIKTLILAAIAIGGEVVLSTIINK